MLTDIDFFAYLENEIPPAIANQIEASADLRLRANTLAHESRLLTALLFRHTCPSADELSDYHAGISSQADTRTVSQHLNICPHCTRELVQIQRFMGEFSAEPTLLQRVKVWFAELMPTVEPTSKLAFRGDEDDLLLYEANGLQISVDVQDDVEHLGYRAIIGLMIGVEETGFKVQLYKSGDHQQTVEVDLTGSFIIDRLQPGEYELILNGGEVLVHLQSLTV